MRRPLVPCLNLFQDCAAARYLSQEPPARCESCFAYQILFTYWRIEYSGAISSQGCAAHDRRRIPLREQAKVSQRDKKGSALAVRTMVDGRGRPSHLLAQQIGRNRKVDDCSDARRNQLCGWEAWGKFLLFARLRRQERSSSHLPDPRVPTCPPIPAVQRSCSKS